MKSALRDPLPSIRSIPGVKALPDAPLPTARPSASPPPLPPLRFPAEKAREILIEALVAKKPVLAPAVRSAVLRVLRADLMKGVLLEQLCAAAPAHKEAIVAGFLSGKLTLLLLENPG